MPEYQIPFETDVPLDVTYLRDVVCLDHGSHIESRPGDTVVLVSVDAHQAHVIANCLADQGITGVPSVDGLATRLLKREHKEIQCHA